MADQHAAANQPLPANPEKATLEGRNKYLGFWFFLGGETVLFGSLFGAYLGLRGSTEGAPGPDELFHLDLVFIMTMILLTSSLTSVFAVINLKRGHFKKLLVWMWATVALGAAFLSFEIYEFYEYYHQGLGFTVSAFASSFYTLVGTHGAHVAFGVAWITTLLIRYRKSGITLSNAPKFYTAVLYWHFIDVVWVFIFTVVYLLGVGG
ncbi:cytochrome (ubi)quinol oxidase subunit III [Alkalicoccus chagannorensis]|uniref:cytochrome (ubi)quinol oxidase subunit III n=1 Tax=Alkalicoccus chagannorensis TaxID=427072 RepID=UPI000401A0EB|nr:cytochrome (ubi)quinol oxidase subunit III [Alkalicoccus chagannorensis]